MRRGVTSAFLGLPASETGRRKPAGPIRYTSSVAPSRERTIRASAIGLKRPWSVFRNMVHGTVHTLSALFALVSGTAAGLLSILFWRVLRETPFGTVIALLSGTMSVMIVYHVALFLVEPDTVLLDTFRSALYTVVAIFLWLVIATHRQIKKSATEG